MGLNPVNLFHMAVLAIVLVGLLYGFFIAIICGQRINERHYHVLAKQELTKVWFLADYIFSIYLPWLVFLIYNIVFLYQEYIVEDRDCKNVPELDQSHVMELRMLGLYWTIKYEKRTRWVYALHFTCKLYSKPVSTILSSNFFEVYFLYTLHCWNCEVYPVMYWMIISFSSSWRWTHTFMPKSPRLGTFHLQELIH